MTLPEDIETFWTYALASLDTDSGLLSDRSRLLSENFDGKRGEAHLTLGGKEYVLILQPTDL